MPTNYIKLIESLRHKQALSVRELCGNQVSHSSYSRFIHKGQALSADKLIYLLKQLELNGREILQFDQINSTSYDDYISMDEAIQSNDLKVMERVAAEFNRQSSLSYDYFALMAIQIRLQMGEIVEAQQIQKIKEHIFQVQHWGYKEIQLYTLILHQNRSSVILSEINKVYSRAANTLYLEKNLDLIRLLDTAHYEFLKRSDTRYAKDIIEKMASLMVNQTHLPVQAFYAINRSLHAAVFSRREADYAQISRLYKNFQIFDMAFLARRLRSRYEELQPIHGLSKLKWEG